MATNFETTLRSILSYYDLKSSVNSKVDALKTNDSLKVGSTDLAVFTPGSARALAITTANSTASTCAMQFSDGTSSVTLTTYAHPTVTAADPAAVKVGYDALGHVVVGSALTAGDISGVVSAVTLSSESAGQMNLTVNGTAASAVTISGWSDKADLASPAFTGTPTAPTASKNTSTTQIATTAFVCAEIEDKIVAAQAMVFKGTIGTNGSAGTTLPTNAKAGWTYRAVEGCPAVGGKNVEVGDLIICVKTSETAPEWTVVQNNLDGAVIGPASSVDGNFAVFDGTTGKVIKGGSFNESSFVQSAVLAKGTGDDANKVTLTGSGGAVSGSVVFGTAAWKAAADAVASDSADLPTGSAVAAYVATEVSTAVSTASSALDTKITNTSSVLTANLETASSNLSSSISTTSSALSASISTTSSALSTAITTTSSALNDKIEAISVVGSAPITVTSSGKAFTITHDTTTTSGGTAGTSSATSGSTTLDVPYVTYDKYGHVTAAGTHVHTITFPEADLGFGKVTDGTTTVSAATANDTLTITAGAGVTATYNASSKSIAFGHSNSVTAGSTGNDTGTSGSTLSVPFVEYDDQGHITVAGNRTHEVTGFLKSIDASQSSVVVSADTVNVITAVSASGSTVAVTKGVGTTVSSVVQDAVYTKVGLDNALAAILADLVSG